MDMDLKLIEGVKQCPILYNNNFTLEERNHAWLQLAEKLKTNDRLLKIRWHYLMQRYQREVNFRYSKRMNFLQRHATTHHSEAENWPEFIITEEDLKDDHPEEKEEFHYIMDVNEHKNECKIKNEEEFDNTDTKNRNNTKPLEHNSTDSVGKDQADEEKADADNETSKDGNLSTKTDKETSKEYNENHTNITNKIADMNMEKNMQHKSTEKDSTNKDFKPESSAKSIVGETAKETEAVKEKAEPQPRPRNERCEDVIFGELVTAMLMRMDESKKKNIKKEIMNLLLS